MKKLTLLVVALVAITFANCDWKKGVSSLAKSVTGVDDANYDYAKGNVGTDAGDFENTFDKLIEKKRYQTRYPPNLFYQHYLQR